MPIKHAVELIVDFALKNSRKRGCFDNEMFSSKLPSLFEDTEYLQKNIVEITVALLKSQKQFDNEIGVYFLNKSLNKAQKKEVFLMLNDYEKLNKLSLVEYVFLAIDYPDHGDFESFMHLAQLFASQSDLYMAGMALIASIRRNKNIEVYEPILKQIISQDHKIQVEQPKPNSDTACLVASMIQHKGTNEVQSLEKISRNWSEELRVYTEVEIKKGKERASWMS
jgi:hypothetical protein